MGEHTYVALLRVREWHAVEVENASWREERVVERLLALAVLVVVAVVRQRSVVFIVFCVERTCVELALVVRFAIAAAAAKELREVDDFGFQVLKHRVDRVGRSNCRSRRARSTRQERLSRLDKRLGTLCDLALRRVKLALNARRDRFGFDFDCLDNVRHVRRHGLCHLRPAHEHRSRVRDRVDSVAIGAERFICDCWTYILPLTLVLSDSVASLMTLLMRSRKIASGGGDDAPLAAVVHTHPAEW